MGLDLSGAHAAVEDLNKTTIPEAAAALREMVEELHGVLDRMNGISVVMIVPPRERGRGPGGAPAILRVGARWRRAK